MAHEAERQELIEKVSKLFAEKFGGDYRQAFDHYDCDKKGIDQPELMVLLEDAGLGNWLTRGLWARGIIQALDADQDGVISFTEFESVLKPQNCENCNPS